jgi:hypothetical protein
VAIGLLALVTLPLPFLRSMGYGGLLIPLVSVVVALTLLPVVLVRFGDRLDWPHRRSDANASRAWSGWAHIIIRRRWTAALAAAAVLAALIVAVLGMNLGTDDPSALAKTGDAKTGLVELPRSGIASMPSPRARTVARRALRGRPPRAGLAPRRQGHRRRTQPARRLDQRGARDHRADPLRRPSR